MEPSNGVELSAMSPQAKEEPVGGSVGWSVRFSRDRQSLFLVIFIMLADLSSQLALCMMVLDANTKDQPLGTPPPFMKGMTMFYDECYDVLAVAIVRTVIVVILIYLMGCLADVYHASEATATIEEAAEEAIQDGITAALLPKKVEGKEVDKVKDAEADPEKAAKGKGKHKKAKDELEGRALREHLRKERIKCYTIGLKVCVYVMSFATQIYAGVKVILFNYDDSYELALMVTLLASPIIWGNLLLYLLPELLQEWLLAGGVMMPSVHPHRLFWEEELRAHSCDYCRSRAGAFYRCKSCDFDLCKECFKRKGGAKNRGEGQVRGDKGTREDKMITMWEFMCRTMQIALPHSCALSCAFISLLATSGVSLLMPKFQGMIINDIAALNMESFNRNIRMYVTYSVSLGVIGGIRGICFSIVGRRMEFDAQNRLFKAIISQDIAFFDGATTGELTSRLTGDVYFMVAPVKSMLGSFISNIIHLIGGTFMCFQTDWRLAILAATVIGPILNITKEYAIWARGINRQIWQYKAEASSVAVQALTNIRTVRAFGQEHIERNKFEEYNLLSLAYSIRDAWTSSLTFLLTAWLDLGATVLILWYGGILVIDQGTLDIGRLMAFQLYWNMMNGAYQSLAGSLQDFTRAAGAAHRVMILLDNRPDIDPEHGALVTHDTIKGELELKNVEFFYQQRPDNPVIKKVNLNIPAGKVLALVGRSGGGKSTLVHLLMRFYDPCSGGITLDGVPLTELNPRSLHNNIGLVAQDTQLFATTIEDNIGYGVEDYTTEDVYAAAKKANAHDFIMGFEAGYQTRVGDRGIRLSGGQKQRIAIARIMLRKPKLLFLDEATSSLDAESESLVQDALDKLIAEGGCTIVLVAHRLSTVVNADKIAVIDNGTIKEQGTHSELINKGGVYAKLVAKQVARQQNLLDEDELKTTGKEKVKGKGKKAKKAAVEASSTPIAVDNIDRLLADCEDDET
eukprot:gb/GEZN01000903.1/.p1 GENE.gb/GEZN01000903.1/~~gb/GEZN01000903.1/.p1  ORF type:complete len:968 (-),score=167.68 gb/GEZN01000903.1/:572-3475(-)